MISWRIELLYSHYKKRKYELQTEVTSCGYSFPIINSILPLTAVSLDPLHLTPFALNSRHGCFLITVHCVFLEWPPELPQRKSCLKNRVQKLWTCSVIEDRLKAPHRRLKAFRNLSGNQLWTKLCCRSQTRSFHYQWVSWDLGYQERLLDNFFPESIAKPAQFGVIPGWSRTKAITWHHIHGLGGWKEEYNLNVLQTGDAPKSTGFGLFIYRMGWVSMHSSHPSKHHRLLEISIKENVHGHRRADDSLQSWLEFDLCWQHHHLHSCQVNRTPKVTLNIKFIDRVPINFQSSVLGFHFQWS